VLHPITRLIVGGAQENTIFTAARLDKSKYQAEILSGPQTGSEGSLIEEARKLGIPLIILPQLVRQISPLNDLISLIKIYNLIKDDQYQIVHTHSSKAGIIGRLAARLAGVPVVIHTVHGWSYHDYMSPVLRQLYILLERWTASFTDVLIVVSGVDIQKGLNAGIGNESRYRLIHSAIPLDQFNPSNVEKSVIREDLGIPEDAIVVGNVGRFSPQKNPIDWVKIAGEIGRLRSDVYFLLVGDGPLRSDVEEALVREDIQARTILTGLRRDPERMMGAMDIFLLTSLWEGLPRVLPQAMAMGLPVIAYQADGTGEIIQHAKSGYLCPPGDIHKAVEYCCQLIDNPPIRMGMGELGRKTAIEKFNLSDMLVQIEALYADQLSTIEEHYTIG
jgi:glycosyltransferase involved in cell wall biosynthesis